MKPGASPKSEPVHSHEPGRRHVHSGEGANSAWQALQQVARTKPGAGFLPIRSMLQERLSSTKKS